MNINSFFQCVWIIIQKNIYLIKNIYIRNTDENEEGNGEKKEIVK